jgi:hypothetical protein
MHGFLVIKHVRPNVFDVFVGNGWNWSRITRRNGDLQIIGGNQLNNDILNKVKARICK